MRLRTCLLRALAALIALTLTACPDEGGGSDPAADGTAGDGASSDSASGGDGGGGGGTDAIDSPACQKDPALIAQKQACLMDDLCPCGTHCELGQCVATCTEDSVCGAGERCDDFGRCTPEGQAGKIGPFQPAVDNRVRVSPPVLPLASADPSWRVRLDAAVSGGRARLVARGPLEVQCEAGGDFAAECIVADVPATGVEVLVRRAPAGKADDPAPLATALGVAVFDEAGRMSFVAAAEVAVAAPSPLTGRFEGFVWLQSPAPVAGPAEGSPVLGALDFGRAAARVTVYAGGVVEVLDRDGLVLTEPLVLATTRSDDGSLSSTLPALLLYTRTSADGEAAEVTLPSVSSVDGRLDEGLVELRFDAPLLGLDLAGDGLPWQLVISATRVGDLPEGATVPGLTPDAAPTEDPARGTSPSPAFLLARALADAGDPAAVPGDLVPFAAVGEQANGVACFASPAEVAAVAAGRDAVLIGACQAAYGAAQLGLGAPAANGEAVGATCEGAPVAEAVTIPCQWARVDQVQVGTGCQQCVDGCVAAEQAHCAGDYFSGYCGQFDPQVNCTVCEDELFQPIQCNNPTDQNCYDACVSYCQGVKNGDKFKMEAVVARCDADCKAPPSSCTPAPVFETKTVVVGSCEDIAATWGCAIHDAIGALEVVSGGQSVTYELQKACTFDGVAAPTEAQCVVAAQCLDPAAFGTNVGYGPGLSGDSGDPVCSGAVDPLFPFLEGPIDDLEAALDACAADAQSSVFDAPTLDALFGSAGCFDRGRFYLVTDRAFAGTRAGAGDPTAEALGHRAVQSFVHAHGLVATLGLNLYREQLVLGKVADPSAAAADALDRSMDLWPVVLHPRIAGALAALSPDVVSAPDPRPRLGFDATDAVATARVGLAVDLVEALSAQLALVDALLERAWFEGNASRIAARREQASELLRLSAPIGALVASLSAAASPDDSTWQAAWERVTPTYRSAVEGLARRLDVIASGANPIGIEDEDLPLYYQGDPLSANERFSAVSIGLLGTGPGAFTTVPIAISQAQEALADVGDAWQLLADNKAASEERIQDIKYRYGEVITSFCGASIENDTNYAGPGQLPCLNPGSLAVFDCPEMDTDVCFVEEACRPRAEAFLEEATSADLGAQLCVLTGLRRIYGANLVGATPELDALLRDVDPALTAARTSGEAFPFTITSLELRSANVRVAVVDVDGVSMEVPLDALGGLDVKTPAFVAEPKTDGEPSAQKSPYQVVLEQCEASRQKTLDGRPGTVPPSCTLADECPNGDACREGHCEALSATDPLDSVDCYYDGGMAEQAIAVRAAADDVAIARREFDELVESYDIARKSCILLKAGNEAQEEQLAAHTETMKNLDIARTALASTAAAASATKDCAASFNVETIVTGAVAGVCVASAVEGVANVALEIVSFAMDEAERAHEQASLAIQNNTDEAICFNDAEMELVGARAALMRIERAVQDQAIAVVNLRGQKSYTAQLFDEGHEAIALEEARLERSLPSRFVLSEAAARFTRRMDYARRVTYLAVRAVEYEFQASLKDRQTVLAATRPDELEAVAQSLSTWVNAGKVGGASPGSLHAVVSLREHLLQLGNLAGDPAGQKGLTDVERFRLLLTSRQFADYDEDGNYLGQLLPFGMAPLGTLGLGKSQGLPIVADNDCAERLWSVNAAVLGEGVYEGNVSSFTRLDLLKKNTFFSQWCKEPTEDEPFQVASVRPAINLLQDPADPNRHKPTDQDVNDYTRGRMQPYLNVSREEFEQEDYAQGATTELAGRGLYGDYALFIPKSALSLDGSAGLRLEKIEDILLRLDYVSVAR